MTATAHTTYADALEAARAARAVGFGAKIKTVKHSGKWFIKAVVVESDLEAARAALPGVVVTHA